MKLNWMMVALVSGVLAVSGCKKDKKADEGTGSGSPATGSSMAGSSATGSGMANPTEGSGTMAGSGSGTMAGSGSGTMAGSGGGTAWSAADVEKVITDAIALMDEIGKGVTGKDCAGAAAAINGSLDKHKAVVDKIASVEDDDNFEKQAEQIMEAKGLEKQLETAMKPIEEVGEKCEKDAAFQAAGDRLKAVLK
jgi:hypothetical protein